MLNFGGVLGEMIQFDEKTFGIAQSRQLYTLGPQNHEKQIGSLSLQNGLEVSPQK